MSPRSNRIFGLALVIAGSVLGTSGLLWKRQSRPKIDLLVKPPTAAERVRADFRARGLRIDSGWDATIYGRGGGGAGRAPDPGLAAETGHRGEQPFHPEIPMAAAAAGQPSALANLTLELAARHLGRRPVRCPDAKLPEPLWHQLLEATPWGRQPKYLIHDRDAVYGGEFHRQLRVWASAGCGPRHAHRTRTPWPSGSCGRFGRNASTRLIVIDEPHLPVVLAEFADYYNRDRPHRSLGLQSPIRSSLRAGGRVVSRPVLGGLHHAYARAA